MKTNTPNKITLAKTMLIVVGVIIAILLTISSSMFVSANELVKPVKLDSREMSETASEIREEEERSNNGGSLVSYKTVFQFFVENLPHLNDK